MLHDSSVGPEPNVPGVRHMLPGALVSGIAYLAGGEAVNLVLSLASFVLATRLLRLQDYGAWATILAALPIITGLTASGLSLATVQAIASEDGEAYVVPALALRLATAAGGGLVALLLALLVRDRLPFAAVLAAGPGFLGSALVGTCEDTLRARRQFRNAAALENTARGLLVLIMVSAAAALLLAGVHRPSVTVLFVAWSATWYVALVIGIALVRPPLPAWSARTWQTAWQLGRTTPVLGLIAVVTLFQFRIEVVLLELLRSSGDAGRFNVAVRIFTVALAVPAVVVEALFPYLLHARRERVAGLERHTGRLVAIVFGTGAAAGVALAFVAPALVTAVAGPAYREAGTAARVLALLIGPAYLSSIVTILLIERHRQRLAAAALTAPALLAYCFELALVHRYGTSVCLAAGGGAVVVSCLLLLAAAMRTDIVRLPPWHGAAPHGRHHTRAGADSESRPERHR